MKKLSRNNYLIIRALEWASDRGTAGFTWNELVAAVADDKEEKDWIKRFMLGEIQGDPPLIFHHGTNDNGEYLYFLTGSGASALIDYLELKEARETGRRAHRLAIAAIAIGAIVGIAQIVVQICFR